MASQTDNGLQVSIEEGAAWRRKLVITVPAERVKTARARAAQQIAKRVKLRGFRKGKVPAHILEARFSEDIDRHTQQSLIDAAFEEAVEGSQLEPISAPQVASITYDPEAEFTFEVNFDVRPQITLSRTSGFRVKRPAVEVSDAEVESRLGLLRRQAALWKPAERHPQMGDSVEVVIEALDGGDREARPYRFVLGEGRAIPGVEAAIMKLQAGESGEFEVEFPDDFPDESKRGGSQRLRIELRQVLEQELPPLDDEFARAVSEFADLGSLKRAVADDLRREKDREAEAEVERQLMEQLIEANPFEVPETMVDRYITVLLGAPPEGADPEAVRAARDEARPAAIWGIKRTLILQRVAEEQGFEATKEEIAERIEAIATRAGRSVSEVRSRLARSGDLRDLERRIVDEKVFDFLKSQASIEDSGS